MGNNSFEAPYRMNLTRYVYIPMRDGVRLSADIYRPSEGRFPCLMVRTPYNKNGFSAEEAAEYVRSGYVLAVVDARGTGGSEGDFQYHNIPDGLGDGADVVNWLAGQPFCNGQVGTFGGSALGVSQTLAAREKPEALRAMFVEVAPLDFYEDRWFPGGIYQFDSTIDWVELMTANIGPVVAVEEVDGDIDAEGDRIRHRVSIARRQVRRRRSLAGQCPTPQDWFALMCAHPERDDYWKTYEFREIVRNCDIPTYYRAVLYDHFIRASCESYQLHRGPKRLVITPGQQGVHGLHADLDLCRERLRWFDYYLKGIQNGVPDDPPVEVFVMGEEKWHAFADWPPSVRERRLALSAGAALVEPRNARPFQDIFTHDPADPIPSVDDVQDIRAYAERALVYTSEPLESDVTVVGAPAVKLHIRSSAPDAYIIVKLGDVFPDGRIRQVASGRLRAAHRAGHEKAVPLSAGETADLSIPLWPTANTFREGHRVCLVVAGSDAPYCDIYDEVSENSLVGTAANESVLVLPEVAG